MSFFFSNTFPQAEKKFSVGIVKSEFHETLTEKLLAFALKGFKKCGIQEEAIEVITVPGSLEIPFAARKLKETGDFDGILVLGIVMRGETFHFELVAQESARGITDVNSSGNVPIINGILTTENEDQAIARLEKGVEFASSLVKMMNFSAALER